MRRKILKYATIKITLEREIIKIGKSETNYKDKLYFANIVYPTGNHIMFAEKTLKKLFKQIKEQMYI
jgi:hypothetical protein